MPLTSIAQEGDVSEFSLSQQFPAAALAAPGVGPTANRFARQLSSSTVSTPLTSSGSPPPHGTVVATATSGKKQQQRERKTLEDTNEESEGGFLSVLVSLIETVAGPLSPERSRAGGRRPRREKEGAATAIARASAGSFSEVESMSNASSIRSPSPTRHHVSSSGARQAAPRSILTAANGDGGRRDCREEGDGTSPSHGGVLDDEDDDVRKKHWVDPNRPVPQLGFGSGPPSSNVSDDYQRVVPAATVAAALAAVMSRPREESHHDSPLMSTASSIDPGEEELMPLHREFGAGGLMKRGFPGEGPMKRGFGPR